MKLPSLPVKVASTDNINIEEKIPEAIAQLNKQRGTPRENAGLPTSTSAQSATSPTDLPSDLKETLQTTRENLALHNDPNKPRLTQGKPDALSGFARGAGEFRDGLFQGPPGAAGNMGVDLDKATALQILAINT